MMCMLTQTHRRVNHCGLRWLVVDSTQRCIYRVACMLFKMFGNSLDNVQYYYLYISIPSIVFSICINGWARNKEKVCITRSITVRLFFHVFIGCGADKYPWLLQWGKHEPRGGKLIFSASFSGAVFVFSATNHVCLRPQTMQPSFQISVHRVWIENE